MTAAIGVFAAVALVLGGSWLVVRDDGDGGTAPPVAGAPAGPSWTPPSSSSPPCWVLASELSAHDGVVTEVTAVRVAFTRRPG